MRYIFDQCLNRSYSIDGSTFQLEKVQRNSSQHQLVMDFIRESSYPPESLRKVRGLQGLSNWLDHHVPGLLKQDASIVICNTTNRDSIAGVAVNHLIRKDTEWLDQPTSHMGVKVIARSLQRLHKEGDIFKRDPKLKQGMNIFYFAVKDRYGQRGLGKKLIEKSLEVAQERQLDFVQSFTVGPSNPSSRLFDRLEFVTLTELKLSDCFVDGAPAFPHAGVDDIIRYVVKKL